MDEKKSELKKILSESDNIVFLGGAGVSTESGVPDFRGVDGLYTQKWKYPPETIISIDFFRSHPKEFFEFYREKLLIGGIKPNRAHLALAKLERQGKLRALITQNIDGLHQAAGSKNVLELHGSVERNYCESCGKFFAADYIAESDGIPRCECGGSIKPDVVLYGEQLNQQILKSAMRAISGADVLVVAGTSLRVYPAAGLIDYYNGSKLVLINKSPTSYDRYADLLICTSVGEALGDAVGIG